MTVRNLKSTYNWQRWTKVAISVVGRRLAGHLPPLPSLIDQIKTLGELRVVTRNGPARLLPRPGRYA